jgi:polyhydroxyalkanoate synthase
MFGQPMESVVREQKGDKRFKHDDWQDNMLFSYIKQSYLLTSGWIYDMVANVEGFDDKTKKKLQFLYPPVRGCAVAQQLRDDQSGSGARHD